MDVSNAESTQADLGVQCVANSRIRNVAAGEERAECGPRDQSQADRAQALLPCAAPSSANITGTPARTPLPATAPAKISPYREPFNRSEKPLVGGP